jgi:hypothetical protein
MFLIRAAFWITVVIFLIPVGDEAPPSAADVGEPINAFEAVGAAQSTIQDMGGFCDRNPDVCQISGRVAHTFALKARTGALWVYDVLDRKLGGTGQPATGADPSAGTLSQSDLDPEWSGPAPEGAI